MWARICEILLAIWLAASPLVFGHVSRPLHAVVDWSAAALVALLAGLSFSRRLYRAHLGEIPVALVLMAYGYFGGSDPLPPALQNDLLIGLLLAMFAILPSRSSEPPRTWQAWHESHEA